MTEIRNTSETVAVIQVKTNQSPDKPGNNGSTNVDTNLKNGAWPIYAEGMVDTILENGIESTSIELTVDTTLESGIRPTKAECVDTILENGIGLTRAECINTTLANGIGSTSVQRTVDTTLINGIGPTNAERIATILENGIGPTSAGCTVDTILENGIGPTSADRAVDTTLVNRIGPTSFKSTVDRALENGVGLTSAESTVDPALEKGNKPTSAECTVDQTLEKGIGPTSAERTVDTTLEKGIGPTSAERTVDTTLENGIGPTSAERSVDTTLEKGIGPTNAECTLDITLENGIGTTNAERKKRNNTCCGDKRYQKKLIRTVSILWNSTIFGWTFGMIGPTLPDLQLISGSDLQQASWLFTGFNVGYLVACASSNLIQQKVHPDILLSLCNIGHALAAVVLPWIPNIYVMTAVRGVWGYCCGGQEIVLAAMIFATWHDEAGPFLQMMHFLFAMGGIISPLVSKPFQIKVNDIRRVNVTDINPATNITNMSSSNVLSPSNNLTEFGCNLTAFVDISETFDRNPALGREHINGAFLNTQNTSCEEVSITVTKETNVHFAFLIAAILVFSAALPFFVFYKTNKKPSQESNTPHETKEDTKKVSNKVQLMATLLLCIVSGIGTGIVDSFPSFLATFGLLQLGWSQGTGSSLTSLYFAMYAVGNLIGVFALKCISSRSFIFAMYSSSLVSLLLFFVGVELTTGPLVWITVAFTGLTTSAMVPTVYTWTQEAVTPISGKIASVFLFGGSAGAMFNPILLGFLMESVSPMWLLYLNFAEVLFCTVLFTLAVLIVRKYLKDTGRKNKYFNQIQISNTAVRCISNSFNDVHNQTFDSEYHSKSTLVYF